MKYTAYDFILQIFGKKNVFGYSKTSVNQQRLIYWLLGQAYHSTVFTRPLTQIFIAGLVLSIIIILIHCTLFILLSKNRPLSMILFCFVGFIGNVHVFFLVPLSSYLYNDDMIRIFELLDRTEVYETNACKSSRRSKPSYDSWVPVLMIFTQVFFPSLYAFIVYYNTFTNFDSNRPCDLDYFIYPLYCDNVRGWVIPMILQCSQVFSLIPTGVTFFLIPLLTFLITKEFYFKFKSLTDSLEYQTELFTRNYQELLISSTTYDDGEKEMGNLQEYFLNQIRLYAKYHHRLQSGINHLKPYLQFNMSISFVSLIIIEVLVVYIMTLMNEESLLLKVRFLSIIFILGTIQFVYCISAKLFANMAQMFGDTVYDVPWYYMTASVRKSVHLLLYQARVDVEFRALKLYPLNMGFFLRSCNNVYSAVNVLRRKTIIQKND